MGRRRYRQTFAGWLYTAAYGARRSDAAAEPGRLPAPMSLVTRLRLATLVSGDVVVDRAEVERRIGTCCTWLSSQGVGPGDRVAIDIPGGISFAVVLMACLRLGATAAPID